MASLCTVYFVLGGLRAGKIIHEKLLVSLLRTTMRYVGTLGVISISALLRAAFEVVGQDTNFTNHYALHARHSNWCGPFPSPRCVTIR